MNDANHPGQQLAHFAATLRLPASRGAAVRTSAFLLEVLGGR